ncbi:MAG: hypothetical protein ACYDHT_07030 [Solirubrobacteraceae bacterium]
MMERPRPWFSLDNAFLMRGSIETLADEFPGFGPLAIVALICEASGRIGGGKQSDFDVLDWHYSYLARRLRTDAATAKAIVAAGSVVGLVEVISEDGDAFTLRLLRWKDWHPKDPPATERKRRERARKRAV